MIGVYFTSDKSQGIIRECICVGTLQRDSHGDCFICKQEHSQQGETKRDARVEGECYGKCFSYADEEVCIKI